MWTTDQRSSTRPIQAGPGSCGVRVGKQPVDLTQWHAAATIAHLQRKIFYTDHPKQTVHQSETLQLGLTFTVRSSFPRATCAWIAGYSMASPYSSMVARMAFWKVTLNVWACRVSYEELERQILPWRVQTPCGTNGMGRRPPWWAFPFLQLSGQSGKKTSTPTVNRASNIKEISNHRWSLPAPTRGSSCSSGRRGFEHFQRHLRGRPSFSGWSIWKRQIKVSVRRRYVSNLWPHHWHDSAGQYCRSVWDVLGSPSRRRWELEETRSAVTTNSHRKMTNAETFLQLKPSIRIRYEEKKSIIWIKVICFSI